MVGMLSATHESLNGFYFLVGDEYEKALYEGCLNELSATQHVARAPPEERSGAE